MTWLDDFRKRIDEVTKTVTDTIGRVGELKKVPEGIAKATEDLQQSTTDLLDDAKVFITEAGAKAWDALTEEQKAIKTGIDKKISDVITKSTEIIFTPTLVDEIIKAVPKIELPEIKLPEIPTLQDVINALTQIFRPLINQLDELTKGMRILQAVWVPVYDPITKKTYTTFEEYLSVLPQYLYKMGEVAKEMDRFKDLIKWE